MQSVINQHILERSEQVIQVARHKKINIVTAESCTGGMVAASLTAVAGSSDVFLHGFVSYSNAAKQALLGVPASLLAAHGAVSSPVARSMAAGAVATIGHDAGLAVAVTGIAGPGGGSVEKPVGLVFIASASHCQTPEPLEFYFSGDRDGIRRASVLAALEILLSDLNLRSS